MIDLLAEPDLDWVELVVDVVERNAGRPWRFALEQLDDLQRAIQLRPPSAHAGTTNTRAFRPGIGQPTSTRRFRAVVGAVQRATGGRTRNARAARAARGLVLGQPVFTAAERQARIDHAALMLDVAPTAIETMLWSDLPRERPVELRGGRPLELEVAALANVALLQRALSRAHTMSLTVIDDDPRPLATLIRAAAARGLLVTVTSASEPSARLARTIVDIAGPLSLMRRTSVYGRALGELVPLVAELQQWALEIRVELPLTRYSLYAASPVLLPSPPARLVAAPYPVARLRRALARASRHGESSATSSLVVEPCPPMLRAGSELLWPDLAIDIAGTRTYVELIGFWTREYLERKLAAYRVATRATGTRFVLCVDTARAAGSAPVPDTDAEVLPFSKTVPVDELMRRLAA